MPDVVCSRWTVPWWAETLYQVGTSVTLATKGNEEGGIERRTEEVVASRPVLYGELNPSAPVGGGGGKEGEGRVERRLVRSRRGIQGGVKEEWVQYYRLVYMIDGSSSSSSSSSNSPSKTLLTAPVELGESSGGSSLPIVSISDPITLKDTVVFDVYLTELANYDSNAALPSRND